MTILQQPRTRGDAPNLRMDVLFPLPMNPVPKAAINRTQSKRFATAWTPRNGAKRLDCVRLQRRSSRPPRLRRFRGSKRGIPFRNILTLNPRWWDEHLTPALSPSAPQTPPTRRGRNAPSLVAKLRRSSVRLLVAVDEDSQQLFLFPKGEGRMRGKFV